MTAPRLQVETRLAIGASCTHDVFDGTAILNLCPRDPFVSGQDGNLVTVSCRDSLDPMAAPRVAADKVAPQQVFHTGNGAQLAWEITLVVGLSRLGFLPPFALAKPEVNDGSLWHLASLLGLTAGTVDYEPGTAFPPYLYLTTNYQHYLEQWFPVEVDPNNAVQAPFTQYFSNSRVPQAREMTFRVIARENYKKVLPAYFPSFFVADVPGVLVDLFPALTPELGGFTTTVHLTAQLPAELGLLDALLLNLANSIYGWKLFSILTIDGTRRNLKLISKTDVSGAYLIPPFPNPIAIRSASPSDGRGGDAWYLSTYKVTPYPGQSVPLRQQLPLTGAYLIGNPYDF